MTVDVKAEETAHTVVPAVQTIPGESVVYSAEELLQLAVQHAARAHGVTGKCLAFWREGPDGAPEIQVLPNVGEA